MTRVPEYSRSILERESVPSSSDYPKSFTNLFPNGYDPIEDQIKMLATLPFNLEGRQRALDFAEKLGEKPEGMEGPFAFIDWTHLGETHEEAVKAFFKEQPMFFGYKSDRFGKDFFQQGERKLEKLELLRKQVNGGGILVAWGQLGKKFAGSTLAFIDRTSALNRNEFCGGLIEGCSVLITHPERLVGEGELRMEMAGDGQRHWQTGPLEFVPSLYWDKNLTGGHGIRVCGHHHKNALRDVGIVTFQVAEV